LQAAYKHIVPQATAWQAACATTAWFKRQRSPILSTDEFLFPIGLRGSNANIAY